MGELGIDDEAGSGGGGVTSTSVAGRLKKKPVGGPMNLEEIRLNRGLLKQISQMKKASVISQVGAK